MGQYDAAALAGQTFYRAVAAPSGAGTDAYIGLQNPTGSGINTFVDALYVWPGLAGASAEVGIMKYNTPFNKAPFTKAYSTFLVSNYYNGANAKSKTVIWCGDYPTNANPQIDYIFQGPNNNQPSTLEKPPYPYAILAPGQGIAIWMTTPNSEMKVGIWIRELPVTHA